MKSKNGKQVSFAVNSRGEAEEQSGEWTWNQCSVCGQTVEEDSGFTIVEEHEKESFHICSPKCMIKLAGGFSD